VIELFALPVAMLIGLWYVHRHDETKKEMENWSPKKLHAFAGMKDKHDKEIRDYAYNLAKEKEFEEAK